MIIIYDAATGRIEQTVHDPVPKDYEQHLADEGRAFISIPAESDQDMNLYEDFHIDEGILTQRPAFELPSRIELNAGEAVTLTIPVGTGVRVDDGDLIPIDGTSLEIESALPAEYDLRLSNFPYQDHSIKVVIHEA